MDEEEDIKNENFVVVGEPEKDDSSTNPFGEESTETAEENPVSEEKLVAEADPDTPSTGDLPESTTSSERETEEEKEEGKKNENKNKKKKKRKNYHKWKTIVT